MQVDYGLISNYVPQFQGNVFLAIYNAPVLPQVHLNGQETPGKTNLT
jgi:hypothetical protein